MSGGDFGEVRENKRWESRGSKGKIREKEVGKGEMSVGKVEGARKRGRSEGK